MRRADAAVQARSADRSWLRSAGIVAFFTALGPFAGVVIFSVWFGLLLLLETPPNAGWTEGVAVAVQWTLISMLLGMTTGYSIGFLVAAGVGLIVALWEWRFGVVSWLVAFGAVFAIWLVPYLYSGDLYASDGVRLSRTNALLPSYLGAAAISTWAARRIFR